MFFCVIGIIVINLFHLFRTVSFEVFLFCVFYCFQILFWRWATRQSCWDVSQVQWIKQSSLHHVIYSNMSRGGGCSIFKELFFCSHTPRPLRRKNFPTILLSLDGSCFSNDLNLQILNFCGKLKGYVFLSGLWKLLNKLLKRNASQLETIHCHTAVFWIRARAYVVPKPQMMNKSNRTHCCRLNVLHVTSSNFVPPETSAKQKTQWSGLINQNTSYIIIKYWQETICFHS